MDAGRLSYLTPSSVSPPSNSTSLNHNVQVTLSQMPKMSGNLQLSHLQKSPRARTNWVGQLPFQSYCVLTYWFRNLTNAARKVGISAAELLDANPDQKVGLHSLILSIVFSDHPLVPGNPPRSRARAQTCQGRCCRTLEGKEHPCWSVNIEANREANSKAKAQAR